MFTPVCIYHEDPLELAALEAFHVAANAVYTKGIPKCITCLEMPGP